MTRRLLCLACAIALGFVCLCPAVANGQDIHCGSSDRRYDRPGNCQRACKAGVAGLGGCFLVPQCKALKDESFILVYNRALFGKGSVGLGPNPREVLVAFIINHWLAPNKYRDFNVVWAKPDEKKEWAHVDPPIARGGKPTLKIAPDAVWLSPAGLASSLGHEMIHVEQWKRTYKRDNRALTPFRELEASTWETGASNFHWSIGPSHWSTCLPQDEKRELEADRICRDWQVRKAIEQTRDMDRLRGGAMATLESYINDDPWIRQVWLPAHPGWKTITAGQAPPNCP